MARTALNVKSAPLPGCLRPEPEQLRRQQQVFLEDIRCPELAWGARKQVTSCSNPSAACPYTILQRLQVSRLQKLNWRLKLQSRLLGENRRSSGGSSKVAFQSDSQAGPGHTSIQYKTRRCEIYLKSVNDCKELAGSCGGFRLDLAR